MPLTWLGETPHIDMSAEYLFDRHNTTQRRVNTHPRLLYLDLYLTFLAFNIFALLFHFHFYLACKLIVVQQDRYDQKMHNFKNLRLQLCLT